MEALPLQDQPLDALGFDPAELERKIAGRTAGRIRNLRVEAVEGGVVLWGRTSTYYVKQLATQVALDEQARLPLTNSIEVV